MLAAIALAGVVAMPFIQEQLLNLTSTATQRAEATFKEQGCAETVIVSDKKPSVGFDPVGPGPFKASGGKGTVRRFSCPDGSTHELRGH